MDDPTDAAPLAPDEPEPEGAEPDGVGDADQAEICPAVERVLVAQGPLAPDELVAAFEVAEPALAALLHGGPGGSVSDRLQRRIGPDERFWRLGDGRIVAIRHHLRATTLTHRLTASEIDRGALDLVPDLIGVSPQRPFRLADGTELTTATSDTDDRAAETGSALGPPGWLDAYAPGTLLAFRYDGEVAHLDVAPDVASDVSDAAAVARAVAALTAAYEALPTTPIPDVQHVVVDAIGNAPDAFATALPPVADLLAAAGLRVRLIWVGPADRSWTPPPEQLRNAKARELLAEADRCCQQAGKRAVDAWNAWLEVEAEGLAPRPEAEPSARLAADIGHGVVAGVLAELATSGRTVLTKIRMGRWAEAAAAAHGGAPLAGIEFLRAVADDAAGDALAAEARLRAALGIDPQHTACLLFLADLAAERGDALELITLANRAGRVPNDAALGQLAPFLTIHPVGRNEPCPCGSGRKYKVCCSGRTLRRPLPLRARWMLERAGEYAARRDVGMGRRIRAMFDPMSDFGTSEVPMSEQSATLARDQLLFDDGLRAYLDVRGPLLPDDELACARGWLGAPMRLLEIVSNEPADGGLHATIEAVDVGTGASRTITAIPPLEAVAFPPGALVVARPLPVGDTWILSFAFIVLPEASRARAEGLAAGDINVVQLVRTVLEVQLDAMASASSPFPLPELLAQENR